MICISAACEVLRVFTSIFLLLKVSVKINIKIKYLNKNNSYNINIEYSSSSRVRSPHHSFSYITERYAALYNVL